MTEMIKSENNFHSVIQYIFEWKQFYYISNIWSLFRRSALPIVSSNENIGVEESQAVMK